jgi:autotransporter-associated beta strand protein
MDGTVTALAVLGGDLYASGGFTKDGPGTVVLNPSANNTYSGLTTVNNGVLQVGGNDSRIYVNGDLLVNPPGSFKFTSGAVGGIIPLTATVTVNGGNVFGAVSGKFFNFSTLVLDNNGSITMPNPPAGNFYFNPANTDARSGFIYSNLYRTITNNLSKSTAGTVIISNRPNASATRWDCGSGSRPAGTGSPRLALRPGWVGGSPSLLIDRESTSAVHPADSLAPAAS